MYLYVKTPFGRFADTREIDSDNLTQFVSKETSLATADSVNVEEYEEFFANILTSAEQVIHFAVSSRCGGSYEVAVQAARGFDHVRVVDSGLFSGGQGILVLHAAKMAMEGRKTEEICEEIEKIKSHIRIKFIMPAAHIFSQNGRARAITAKACQIFQLHPMGEVKQGRARLVGLLGGNLENARRQGIHWNLRHKKRISHEIIYITHVGCTVKELEKIKREILRCIPFARIEIHKASFTTACNAGVGTIGLSFYEN